MAAEANELAGQWIAPEMWLIALVFSSVRFGYTAGKADAKLFKCDSVVVDVLATEINLALRIFS